MNRSMRLATALVGLAAVSGTALAQRSVSRWNNCGTPVYRDRGSNVGFSFSIGNSRGWHGNRYWGSHRGFSRAGHDFWVGNRARYNSGFAHYGGRNVSIFNRHHATVFRQPATFCPTPVVRESLIVRRPVIVDRPVVVQRPLVIEQPAYEPIVRDVPVYRDIARADPAQRYRAGWNALRAGDAAYAREFFTDMAVRYPDDPTPKAGLAIARAATGHTDQAEWAMRRAVRAGFSRARDGMPGLDLEAELTRLEQRFADRSDTYNDRWFMLAATRYLLGDSAGAKDAAAQALAFDERDRDARRIYDLVAHTG